jgi:uncharacterized membrane protein
MELADIRFYDVVVAVHVMAVVLGFGPTFGYAVMAVVASRSDPRSVPYMTRVIERTDRVLVIPMMFLLLAAGIYLVSSSDGPYDFSDGWVQATFTIYVILLGFQFLFFSPQTRKQRELAEREIAAAADGEVAWSPEFDKVSQRLGMFGGIAGLLVLVAIFLMTVKPGA